MKKITLFLFLLTASIGYSQTVLEDFEGTAPATNKFDGFGTIEVAENPTVSSEKSLKLITSTTSAGWQGAELIFQGGNLDLSTSEKVVTIDVYSLVATDVLAKVTAGGADSATDAMHTGSGWETLSFNFANGKDGTGAADGVYSNIVFYPTWNSQGGTCSTGCYAGSTASSSPNITLYLDNITGLAIDVTITDASLSDIRVDGTTIAGFGPETLSYVFQLAPGTTDVPAITAIANQEGATVEVEDAMEIPGNAVIVVTASDNTTTKTYTISFEFDKRPSTAAPAPDARNAWDVVSLYSDAYTDLALNFDAGWCGTNSIEIVEIEGNNTVAFKGNNCQGIVLNEAIDVSSFTHMHVDVYIDETVDVTSKVFNLKFVGVPSSVFVEYPFNAGSSPALVAGSWLSIDIPVNLSTMTSFKEFGVTADNLKNQVWYDNLYVYRDATASVENNKLLGFSMYPNPTSNILNISAKETIQNAQIFNVLGKEVMNLNINKNSESIDISSLSSGIYLIKYQSNGAVGTAKFVKE